MKRNILTVSLFLSLMSGASKAIEIKKPHLFSRSNLGQVNLYHDETGYTVEQNGNFHKVEPYCIDKEIRNISDEKLQLLLGMSKNITLDNQVFTLYRISNKEREDLLKQENVQHIVLNAKDLNYIASSSYIEVVQFDDGSFGLHLKGRLLGGGPVAAAVVNIGFRGIFHGIMTVVDYVTGGLTIPIHKALVIPSEVVANIVATAAGATPTP